MKFATLALGASLGLAGPFTPALGAWAEPLPPPLSDHADDAQLIPASRGHRASALAAAGAGGGEPGWAPGVGDRSRDGGDAVRAHADPRVSEFTVTFPPGAASGRRSPLPDAMDGADALSQPAATAVPVPGSLPLLGGALALAGLLLRRRRS